MAEIDNDILSEIEREKANLAFEDEKEFRRAELNAYAELLSQFHELNNALSALQDAYNEVHAEAMTAYFEEFKNNLDAEQKREAIRAKVAEGHRTKKGC